MGALPDSEWEDILGHLRVKYTELNRGWFKQLEPVSMAGGVLVIRAGNPMQAHYLRDHCLAAFREAAWTALDSLVEIQFEAAASEIRQSAEQGPLSFELDDELVLDPDYTFENFVVGPENRLAHAASIAVSEKPGVTYNPLFIHGDVGLGKTHLLQAICQMTERLGLCERKLYISCETFTNHLVEAMERGALKEFRYRYRHVDLLVIDDIQFLAGHEQTQEEFFHTFNTLYQSKKQIVLSADCPPTELPSLEDRLISRFNSGLVTSVDRPSLETRMAIVQKKARLRAIEIPENVVKLVATRIESNIRDIEGALVKLDALSQTRDGRIDLALAEEALGRDTSVRMITPPQILDEVSRRFGMRVADLQGKKRTKSISHPRQICMFLMRELTSQSLTEIGGWFGGRDHTTVLHASRSVAAMRKTDPELDRMLEDISQALKSGVGIDG